jgi:methylated-DNA-[protein]-cysteine S-methyltransferase
MSRPKPTTSRSVPPGTPAPGTLVLFPSSLGWFAIIGRGEVLQHLTFGHPSAAAAEAALDPELRAQARPGEWNPALVRRLVDYASGGRDDFRDVPIDPGPVTPFRRKVIRHCRAIPYGKTLTYGQLADKAGSPAAARAVGQCMAANRIALVIPCHRVVASDGGLGGYSARGGLDTKRRLLELESSHSGPLVC